MNRPLILAAALIATGGLLLAGQSATAPSAEAATQYACVSSTYPGEWGSEYSAVRCGSSRYYWRTATCEHWLMGTKAVAGPKRNNWGTSAARCPWPWTVQALSGRTRWSA